MLPRGPGWQLTRELVMPASYDDAEEGVGIVSASRGYSKLTAAPPSPWAVPLSAATVLALLAILVATLSNGGGDGVTVPAGAHASLFDYCAAPAPPEPLVPVPSKAPPPPTLFVGCEIWTGGPAGSLSGANLLVEGGKISCVGVTCTSSTAERVDCAGGTLTPGIVDIHSHLGVNSYPTDWQGHADTNENFASGVGGIQSMVRAIDAIDPEDPAIVQIRSGGVTVSQVLPGSGNMMGGESAALKMTGGPNCPGCTVESMRLPYRGLKHACGENVKRASKLQLGLGLEDGYPNTRMGASWRMREQYAKARELVVAQDDWDASCAAGADPKIRRPGWKASELKVESIAALLRGTALLHNHCYQLHDMEMMVRLSKEFGFKITAFHHALEAYKFAPELAAEGIAAATWTDDWVGKAEGWDTSFHAPAWLDAQGVKLVLKSDHPVTDSKDLMYMAGRAVYYGLPLDSALRALTIHPAETLGLAHRIGSLEVGKDADIVLWDRMPLRLGASARSVHIDGAMLHTARLPQPVLAPYRSLADGVAAFEMAGPCGENGGVVSLREYAVTGARLSLPGASVAAAGSIVVRDGLIACIGECTAEVAALRGASTFVASGGEVMAGMITAGEDIGLYEMGEEVTHDGTADGSWQDFLGLRAADGLRTGGRHIYQALASGLSMSVVPPEGRRLVLGRSAAVWLVPNAAKYSEALLSAEVALHVMVGNDAKRSGGLAGAVSGQIALLRKVLAAAPEVSNGSLPLVAHASQADAIASLLRLKQDEHPALRLTIFGGAEAHLVAEQLVAAAVPVVLSPPRPIQEMSFDAARAPFSAPLGANVPGQSSLLRTLYDAGVSVSMTGAGGTTSNLRWEAGLGVEQGIPRAAAIEMVTSGLAAALGVPDGVGRLSVGAPAAFTLYTADPLSLESRPELVALGSRLLCAPPATPWDLPWKPGGPKPFPPGVDFNSG